MKVNFKTRKQPLPQVATVRNRNFFPLQKTQFESDKSDFTSYRMVKNMIDNAGNAESRRGYESLVSSNEYFRIDMFEEIDGNFLYGFKADSSNTKIVEIDTSDGTETDRVLAISGQLTPSSTSLNGLFYYTVQTALVGYYDKQADSTGTVTLNGSETAHLLASDESRVWCTFKDTNLQTEILRFSNLKASGNVTTFVETGTDLDRAGIASSNITKFNALLGAGQHVVAIGDNLTEVHKIPSFSAQPTSPTFTANLKTLLYSFPKVGVQSQHAAVAVDDNVYINPGDRTIVRINVKTGSKKVFRDNEGELEALKHANTALGYQQAKNLLLVSVSTNVSNNRVVVFNTQKENFASYTNILADQWVQDGENTYFFNSRNGIFKAFDDDVYLDAGQKIPVAIRTQATDFGTEDSYKVINRYYANVKNTESLDVTVKIAADHRADTSDFNASFSETLPLDYETSYLAPYSQPFGGGDWGGAGITPMLDDGDERLYTQKFVNVSGMRFAMELSASVSKPFTVRGLGLYAFPTSRPTNNLTFS